MPLDAAIVFSDIMVPLAAVGVPVRIEPGRGPVVDEPLRARADVARSVRSNPPPTCPRSSRRSGSCARSSTVPLIGFAGAPFTLASYLVEGGPSKQSRADEGAAVRRARDVGPLMDALVDLVAAHLAAQAEAGAQALQVFDSWVGALHPARTATGGAAHARALRRG